MKKLLIFVLALVSTGWAQTLEQATGFATTGQAIRFNVVKDSGPRRLEYVYGGSLSTVSTVLKGCMRGDTCDTLQTSTSTSNSSRCVADVYDYYTVTPTFTGGTSPTLTVNQTTGPNAWCATGTLPPPLTSVTSGTASAITQGGVPMICDTAASGTVTAAQAQMVRCSVSGVLATAITTTVGDGAANANAFVLGDLLGNGANSAGLRIAPNVYNGALWDHSRSADLTNYNTAVTTTAVNSIGATLIEKGSRWSVFSNPAAGSQASASIASEASVRHVVDCISFSAASTTAPVLTALTVNVRDGASGAGTVIWTNQVVIPAATGQNVAPVNFCGLNLVGTTATAMTVEFSASLANLIESVSISGFNVN